MIFTYLMNSACFLLPKDCSPRTIHYYRTYDNPPKHSSSVSTTLLILQLLNHDSNKIPLLLQPCPRPLVIKLHRPYSLSLHPHLLQFTPKSLLQILQPILRILLVDSWNVADSPHATEERIVFGVRIARSEGCDHGDAFTTAMGGEGGMGNVAALHYYCSALYSRRGRNQLGSWVAR